MKAPTWVEKNVLLDRQRQEYGKVLTQQGHDQALEKTRRDIEKFQETDSETSRIGAQKEVGRKESQYRICHP